MSSIRVEHLYKVFGSDPQRAMKMLNSGENKQTVGEQTGMNVGVDDVSFEVGEGELFVVMGLSGSGKSTLVRMINGLIPATSGHCYIGDQDVHAIEPDQLRDLRQAKISMVFQHFALFPHRKVWRNAAYGLEIRGEDEQTRRPKAEEALERVGLGGHADSYPSQLSGGMQQRVGLARGLATDADILLMDEPFSALDPLIRRDMQELLMNLQEELRRTIIFITHDLNEAMLIGDRIAMMKEGRIIQIGTGPEIVSDPADDYVADFVSDVDRARTLTCNLIMTEPRVTTTPEDDPQKILDRLDAAEETGAYVTDADGRVTGVARDGALAKAVRDGTTTVGEVATTDYGRVAPDDVLLTSSKQAANDDVPVAVIGEDGRLQGVIRRESLLAALVPTASVGSSGADSGNAVTSGGARPAVSDANARNDQSADDADGAADDSSISDNEERQRA